MPATETYARIGETVAAVERRLDCLAPDAVERIFLVAHDIRATADGTVPLEQAVEQETGQTVDDGWVPA